ncbi:VanW family protein [Clostridium hydrogeniformans]|uniref:VanW family protein n=1 Tax=Clostridium hydrogeniformans TaxID=349933 RepID=UPI0004852013|nr:VanW family protein [Clostridium hydrogeniformans]
MQNFKNKPIKRSKIRLFIGKNLFTFKRFLYWYSRKSTFSKEISLNSMENIIFTHKTPLIRDLKNVLMYLQYNKVTNLKIAIKKLNGIIIKPNETFSYWYLIRKPTYRKGYLDGVILTPDGNFKPGVGGGLCQLSNLIYWIVLHSPLEVIERHRHSHDVFPDTNRTQPFGSGATCVYNYMDLQIYNPTNNTYQLFLYIQDGKLVGELRSNSKSLYSYKIYEENHSISPDIFGGYIRKNVIMRKTINFNNDIIKDEFITENHAYMTYNPYISS